MVSRELLVVGAACQWLCLTGKLLHLVSVLVSLQLLLLCDVANYSSHV